MVSDHPLPPVVMQFVGEAQVPTLFHGRQEPTRRSRVSMALRMCQAKERLQPARRPADRAAEEPQRYRAGQRAERPAIIWKARRSLLALRAGQTGNRYS